MLVYLNYGPTKTHMGQFNLAALFTCPLACMYGLLLLLFVC